MLFEVLSCISHVKVYIVAEVYCLYCRPCPAQTDPCQMDRDTQIIQRSLCFIFHLFFSYYILYLFCSFSYMSYILVLFYTCHKNGDTQIIQRPLCFIFHLFFLIIFCMFCSIFVCHIF